MKTQYLDAESCAKFCAQPPIVCDDRACGGIDTFVHLAGSS